jgi:hypothetical protein
MALPRWARVLKGAATASRPIVFDFYPSQSRRADEVGEPSTQREDSCAFQQPSSHLLPSRSVGPSETTELSNLRLIARVLKEE